MIEQKNSLLDDNAKGGQGDGWAINSDINVLEFISENIRQSVRDACLQSWMRENDTTSNNPTSRQEMLDHYHRRALNHIKQAIQGLNIITVVQIEQTDKHLWHRLGLYTFHTSTFWVTFLHCVMAAHLLLAFWKPYSSDILRRQHGYSKGVVVTECLCLVVEIMDIWMTGLIQFRWQDSEANPLVSPVQQTRIFVTRIIVTLLVIIDLCIAQTWYFVLSGYLDVRPLILILANDNLLGSLYAFLMTMYEARDGMLLYLVVWTIAAVAGTLTFRFDVFLEYSNIQSFYNFIRSMMQSFVFMVSGENYENIVYAAVAKSQGLIFYFILLTISGTFLVIPLVVSKFQEGVICVMCIYIYVHIYVYMYITYMRHMTSKKYIINYTYMYMYMYIDERERRKFFKRTGFIAAFCLVNLDNDNVVSPTEFESFISYLKRIPGKEAKELVRGLQGFDNLDDDGNDQIEINEFVVHLENIYNRPTITDIIEDDSLRTWLRTSVIEKESFNQAVLVIIFTEVMLLMMYGTYPGKLSLRMLDIMLGICVLLNGFDVFIKLVVYGWDYYWNTSECRVIPLIPIVNSMHTSDESNHSIRRPLPATEGLVQSMSSSIRSRDVTNHGMMYGPPRQDDPLELLHRQFAHRLDLVIVCVSVTLFIVSRTAFGSNFSLDSQENYFWVRLVMIFPLFRMLTLIRTTRAAVYTVFKVIPRFSSLLVLMLLVFYVYAIFGTALVGNQIEYLTLGPSSFVYFGFGTVAQTWLSLFQMLVSEGWNNIMDETIIATNNFAWAFYFMTFMFIVTLIFTNLFFGMVLAVVDEIEKERKTMDDENRGGHTGTTFNSPHDPNHNVDPSRALQVLQSNPSIVRMNISIDPSENADSSFAPPANGSSRMLLNRSGGHTSSLHPNSAGGRLAGKRSGSTALTIKKFQKKEKSLQYIPQRG
ncbi:cation transporter [Reticulomyxa filosa]|uniref:Cation transporter n=1 Tax=Reticulomyxa filosa TaxID=46433 RepID=X6NAG8_RETFI|nr:cation transporter [Reticulomyxa filosa]|eukprot:ETO22307.1 cation transporter [Reticulomyxa filosa]